jgi:hypothetical protein
MSEYSANRLAHFGGVPRRVQYSESFGYNVIAYGANNSYPQEVRYAVQRSSIASACAKLFAEFLYGEGFKSGGNIVVNREGYTLNDILLRVCRDYSIFYGFALRANYNGLGKYTDIQVEPFEQVRLCLPEDGGQTGKPEAVRISDDWAGESWRNSASPAMAETVGLFDPMGIDTSDLEALREANGQVMYVTTNDCFYTESIFDPVIQQVLTSGDLASFDRNFVANGFSASQIFVNKSESVSDEAYARNTEQVGKLGGVRGAGGVYYLEGDIELLDISKGQKMSDQYVALRDALKDDIHEALNIPPVLLGRTRQGGFPNQDEMLNAFEYFNGLMTLHRQLICRYFNDLALHFAQPLLPEGEKFQILPKRFLSVNGANNAPVSTDATTATPAPTGGG